MKRPIALVIIAVVFAAGFLSVRGAMPFMAIFGSSMEPELNPGDLITTEEVSALDVEVGDVIVFNVPPIVRETYNYPLVVAHRVVRAYTTESGTTFRTQGDNVGGEDPFAVRDEDLRGKVGKKIPYLGFPLLFLQSQLGLIFAIASICTFAYYLYSAEFSRGGRKVYRGLFAPVIQENHRSNRLTERALDKFSSAIETYAEHLNSHTSAIQSLSEASQGLKNSTVEQNKVLARMMETMEQAPVRQERTVPEVEQPHLAEESGEEPLPPAPVSAGELGEEPLPPAPVSAEELGEDFLPPAPVSAEESGEDFLPSAFVSDVITVLELIGQASLSEEDVQNIIESQRKQDALDDCLAVGLVESVPDRALALTSKGKQFLVNGTPPREILKEFLLSRPNIVSCLEKIEDNPRLRPRVLEETLAYSNPGWTEATWERRSKVLTNWLIYTQLVRPIRSRVTGYPARLF